MTMTSESSPTVATQVPKKIVYTVTDKGDKSYWTRIGVAFTNRDGSLTVRLDALPLGGVLQIREDDLTRRAGVGQ